MSAFRGVFGLILTGVFVAGFQVSAHEGHHHDDGPGQENPRHADAHVHGLGSVNIIKVGDEIQVEMEFPADDILGFETMPKVKQSLARFETNLKRVKRYQGWIEFPKKAKCVKKESKFVHSVSDHSEHAEAIWKAKFECASASQIDQIQFPFFEAFGSLEKAKAQVMWDANQTSEVLMKSKPQLKIQR